MTGYDAWKTTTAEAETCRECETGTLEHCAYYRETTCTVCTYCTGYDWETD